MNICLQRHSARYIYVVPDGLKELMSDISREVLRIQPESIYTYIADYLDALMITRENARVAARLVQSLTEIAATTVDLLQRTGMPREEADHTVAIIQRAFRKHLEDRRSSDETKTSEEVDETNIVSNILTEANVDPQKAEMAAIIIQEAYRSFKIRKQREQELLKDVVDWRVAARSAIHLYRKTGVTHEEANRAATLIKAAYKGYYTRRLMRKVVEDERRISEEIQAEDEQFAARLSAKFSKGDAEEKSVRIDYDSVIPHVDFGEAEFIAGEYGLTDEERQLESTTSVIVKHSLKVILEKATREIEARYSSGGDAGQPLPGITEEVLSSPVKSAEFTMEMPPEEVQEPIMTEQFIQPLGEDEQTEQIPPESEQIVPEEGQLVPEEQPAPESEQPAPESEQPAPESEQPPPEGEQPEITEIQEKVEEITVEETQQEQTEVVQEEIVQEAEVIQEEIQEQPPEENIPVEETTEQQQPPEETATEEPPQEEGA